MSHNLQTKGPTLFAAIDLRKKLSFPRWRESISNKAQFQLMNGLLPAQERQNLYKSTAMKVSL